MSEQNKTTVTTFYQGLYSANSGAAMDAHLGNGYVEHQLGTEFSKAGLKTAVTQRMAAYPAYKSIIRRTIAQNDLIFLHVEEKLGEGETAVRGELFRLKNGKIIEHWSAGQDTPKKTASGRSLIDGQGVDYSSNAGRKYAKSTADSYYKTFVELRTDLIDTTTTERYLQHNPRTADGKQAFNKGVSLFKILRYVFIKLHLDIKETIAEGDYVVTMANIAAKPIVPDSIVFDLFRVIDDGKKDEHWDVTETIKPKSAVNKVF